VAMGFGAVGCGSWVSMGFVFVLPGGFLVVRLFLDLLVMAVRNGDGGSR
jgi:hypothetical protein